MKILVTGHKGFIGQNMVKALEGHEVTTMEWGDKPPVIKGLDWVVHLGAISSPSERDVEKVMSQNYDFSIWLHEQCIEHHVNLQWASSASIYGLKAEFKETSPVDPKSPYAWSKYMFERYTERNRHFAGIAGIKVQGFRFFNVYGPHEDHKGNQSSPQHTFNKQAKEKGLIKLFENSDKYARDFVHVDVITSHLKRFFNVNESGIWNIGTGTARTFEEVGREIAASHGVSIEYIPMPEVIKAQYQTYTRADMTKTNKTLEIFRA